MRIDPNVRAGKDTANLEVVRIYITGWKIVPFASSPALIMGKERPGLRWTRPGKGEDEEFMCQLLPDYLQVHSLGAQRKRNPAKKLWLRNRLADYKERYPGRVETWDLKGITEESTKTEREKKYIQVSFSVMIRIN